MNSTTRSQSDSLSNLLNQSTVNNKSQMQDVLKLNEVDLKQQFRNEISMIQNAKDQISSGVFLSNLQKERSDQYDLILAQRRYIWKQEEQLCKQIEHLKQTNKRYKDSLYQYNIRNRDLETTVNNEFDSIQKSLQEVQSQRSQVLQNFDKIQQNLISSKSKLSTTGELLLQGHNNDQQQLLAAHINQQQQKIRYLKDEYNDPKNNQIIPFDKKIQQMAENTFEKQARYIYNGTKFEGNEQQKLMALSTLRRKIEQHIEHRNMGGVILDMPFKVNMTQEQESIHRQEYNETIAQLDDLRNEYIQSGGTDPNYLISLNNLQRHYQDRHPINQESMEQINTTVNLQQRSKIVDNPIFPLLPETFKRDILDLENEVAIKQEAEKRDPLHNPKLLRPPLEVGDTSKAEENMLEHLRQQEAQLLLNQNTFNRAKYEEVLKLKQVYEKRYLEKRVQEELAQKKIEEDVLNQRNKEEDKKTYLQYLQGQIQTMPLFYDADYGFIVRFDYVVKIPLAYDYIKISYGVFTKETDEPQTNQVTAQHELISDGINANQAVLQERFIERGHQIYEETYLYIVLWGFSSEFGGNMVPINIGWTIHKLFDKENLLQGCYQVPFYSESFTFNVNKIAEVQEIKLGMRITTPGDSVLDIQNKLINQYEYQLQQIHTKDIELINQQKLFNFRTHKIFHLPYEFIQVHSNELRLQGQNPLPPNSYKLQNLEFLNNAQALFKKQQDDYEERQNNRYKPRRRFARQDTSQGQTPSERKSTSGKTIIGFRRRLQSKGKETPKSRVSESKIGSRGGSSERSRATQQGKQRMPSGQISGKERNLSFKLRALNQIYVAGIQQLKMKVALFSQGKLLIDDEKKQCMNQFDLEPDEKGDNYLKYTVQHTFRMNLNDYFEDEDQLDIIETYIYIAFFKDEKTLFGWQALPVFEELDKTYRVKSGVYYENLLGPPGQSPPFNLNRTKKMNVQLNCIIMQDDERILQLPQIDNYILDHKLMTEEAEEKRKKIYSVANPKWNTQIRIDLTSIKNFVDKENFIMKLAVISSDEVIIDAIERQCIKIDQILLFEGTGRQEFIANHSVILRIGSRYLVDVFPLNYKRLNYLFSFYNQNKLVGITQFPLFNNQGVLTIGSQKLFLHELDATGHVGKKTSKLINIFILEETLNLKDVEETPKYAKQTKEDKQIAQTDKQKLLTIEIYELSDYIKQDPVDFTIQIYKGIEIATDIDGNLCVNTSSNSFYPKPGTSSVQIRESIYFKMPINYLIDQKQDLDEYQVFISFNNLGWISFPLFINNELNSEEVVAKLFGGVCLQPPVDYRNVRKINTKLSYNMFYDLKPLSEATIQQVKASQSDIAKSFSQKESQQQVLSKQQIDSLRSIKTKSQARIQVPNSTNKLTIKVINVNGYKQEVQFFVKGIILMNGTVLMDKNNKPCVFESEQFPNINGLIFFKKAEFEFQLEIKQLSQDTLLFLQICDQKKTVMGWYYQQIEREGQALKPIKLLDKLYGVPVQKPPINQNKLKSINQTIQFEVN